jgi:hypothetical protein
MMDRAELLKAELVAIDFWDRLYLETPEPSQIETDAARARFFRCAQIVYELMSLGITGPIQ